jgi:hypothetical protein
MKSRPPKHISIGSYLLAVAGGICGMVTEINEEQVSQHIGQEVVVRARVTRFNCSHALPFNIDKRSRD